MRCVAVKKEVEMDHKSASSLRYLGDARDYHVNHSGIHRCAYSISAWQLGDSDFACQRVAYRSSEPANSSPTPEKPERLIA